MQKDIGGEKFRKAKEIVNGTQKTVGGGCFAVGE